MKKIYRIFISCTSEIIEELEFLFKVENAINSIRPEFKVKMLHYSKDVFPSSGLHPQKIINNQLSLEYDVYLGIFWTKYGSPTDEYDSGVIEEFENAMSFNKTIMFYFNIMSPKYLSQFDIENLSKINRFKSSLGAKDILYYEYKGIQDFENVVLGHIVQQIEELDLLNRNEKIVGKSLDEIEDELNSDFYELEYDDLTDFSEFLESIETSLFELKRLVKTTLRNLTDFTQLLENKIEKVQEIESRIRKRKTLALYKLIAKEVKIFRLQLDANIKMLDENSEEVVKEMNNAILFFPKEQMSESEIESLYSLLIPIEEMRSIYKSTTEEIESLKINLVLASKLSHYIRKENRMVLKLMSELQTQIDIYSKNIFDFSIKYIGKL